MPTSLGLLMHVRSIETIIRALNEERVRFLVAGGLAVVAHGYLRYTADMDLILDLAPENVHKAIGVFSKLGYRPLVPVPFEQFADEQLRQQWIADKQMKVFTIFSSIYRDTNVDLMVLLPFTFEEAWARSVRQEVAPGVPANVVGLDDLITMKSDAARPKDVQDIDNLKKLKRLDKDEGA